MPNNVGWSLDNWHPIATVCALRFLVSRLGEPHGYARTRVANRDVHAI
jgi:hypothetical protein